MPGVDSAEMADQWVELLVNAPDRQTAEAFAVRLAGLLPTLEVLMGTGPVRDIGGTPATREATREAVSRALNELDVTLDAGPAAEALDMTVVFVA